MTSHTVSHHACFEMPLPPDTYLVLESCFVGGESFLVSLLIKVYVP
jgi:hypothetical protein